MNSNSVLALRNQIEIIQEKAVKNLLRTNPEIIKNIKNPSIEEQLMAVTQEGHLIRYIKIPTEQVQLEAIKNNPYSIVVIKKPTLNVIELVLNSNLMPIIDIKKYLKIDHLPKEEKNYLKLKYEIY